MSKIAKALVALVAATTVVFAPVAAQAATPGVGDQSNAVRYGGSAPIGTKIDFTNQNVPDYDDDGNVDADPDDAGRGDLDDNSYNIAASFPLNFFGTKYSRVCFSINGGVFPTNDDTLDCSKYDLDVASLADAAEAPMVAVLASDTDLTKCDGTRGSYNESTNVLTTIDDGWADPCSVYVGTTTVDGADAMVITWYRVSQFEGNNEPAKFNTYQLLLIKRATGSNTDGWDFDFEFNYATVQDDEDGYAVDESSLLYVPYVDNANPGSGECSAYSSLVKTGTYDLCRWGIGVGKFENGVGSVGYEFFEQYGIGQLIDSGDTAMIKHSLGSNVLGRYRCSMINGEAKGCDFSAALAETGTDANGFGLAGAALIAAGGIALAVRRRKA